MNKKFNTTLTIAIIIIIAGILLTAIWLQSKNKTIVSKEKQTSRTEISDPLGDIYPIQRIPAVNDRFDAIRYSCQNKKIVSEIEKDDSFGKSPFLWASSVEIMPGNIKLEKIDSTAKFISYTFDGECKNIYSIVNYKDNGISDIFKFNIENGKYVKLTENLSLRWTTLDEAKPDPIFIYVINDKKLLVSFFGVTTGLDAYTNFTIHKIFDLTNARFIKEITFIDDSDGKWLLPQTILNFNKNILSNAIGTEQQPDGNFETLIRKDFDLINETFSSLEKIDANLLKGDQMSKLFFNCPSKNDEPEEYNKCIKENTNNIFPENKK